jgi:hypothetical protein
MLNGTLAAGVSQRVVMVPSVRLVYGSVDMLWMTRQLASSATCNDRDDGFYRLWPAAAARALYFVDLLVWMQHCCMRDVHATEAA